MLYRSRNLLFSAGFVFLGVLSSAFFCVSYAKDSDKKNSRDENGDNFTVASSTHIDFNEAMIDGKFQAPLGFFIQGRQAQAMTQMVKLRPNFRQELRNSRAAVKSLVK